MTKNISRLFLSLILTIVLSIWPAGSSAQSLIRDAEIERTIRMLATPVFAGAGTSLDSVSIYLIGSRQLNAFVAGGRNIFLFSGLLTRLETPEQIQAVLAHELGHINGGHLARRGIQAREARGAIALGVLLAIAAAAAGSGEAAAAALTGTQSVLTRSFLQFTRGEEASADQAALSYMNRGGINPTGMREVLDIFRGQEALIGGLVDPYALTHPLSTDRIQLAERRIAASPHIGKASSPELNYWTQRMRAKLDGFLTRPEQVLRKLGKAPDTEFDLIRRAVALHRLPDPKGAIRAIDALVKKRPNDPFYLELKAQILMETGKVDASIPFLRKALRLAPREPLIQAALGHALIAKNTKATNAEALKILRAATNNDPFNTRAFRNLSLAYARSGNEGLAALASAERFALESRFRDAAIHAKRAIGLLSEGTPGWLKAQDIATVAERVARR